MNVQPFLRRTTLLAGIRAKQSNLHRLPKHLFQGAQWHLMKAGQKARLLTVAGAAQVKFAPWGLALLLPVELRLVNQASSTNNRHCKMLTCIKPTMCDITIHVT